MVVHHHFMYREFTGFKRWLYKKCEWRFLRLASMLIIPSPYVYAEITKQIPEAKVLLWKIPFEQSRKFYPSPIKGNLTFTGTIEHRKGLHFLIESLRVLKSKGVEYNLKIIGKTVDNTYRERLETIISEHSLNVEFTGFISKEEKEKLLSETDIFVFPSLLEGFGMVLVEAQVYALPIISFDNSAMPFSVFNNINGFTVPTGDYKAFAEAIITLMENRQLRDNFGKAAFENSKRQNTQQNLIKEVASYLEPLIQNSR